MFGAGFGVTLELFLRIQATLAILVSDGRPVAKHAFFFIQCGTAR
jgi:hypothetical protein